PDAFRGAPGGLLQFIQKTGTFLDERGELLVAARDRRGIAADFLGQRFDAGGEAHRGQMTMRSVNSCTGVLSSRFASRHKCKIVCDCFAGKRRARLVLNFSTSTGMPSLRRRLWPMGYSQTTSFSFVPSLNSTVSALAIERLSGA